MLTETPVFAHPNRDDSEAKKRLWATLEEENRQLDGSTIDGTDGGRKNFVGWNRSPAQDALIEAALVDPMARRQAPALAILSRHWKQRNSLEEAMLELYHANISAAKVDQVARLLWGAGAGVAVVSDGSARVSACIREWLQREITEPQVYVYFQTVGVKQKVNAESRTSQLVAAIGINRAGIRQGLAVVDANAPDGLWDRLLAELKHRHLRGVALFVGGNDPAAHAAVARHFPGARYQGCLLHLQRDAQAKAPVSEVHALMMAFDRLRQHTTESEALAEMAALVTRLRKNKLAETAALLEQCAAFQFNYLRFPTAHWSRLHDIEPLKNVLSEFREHIRIIGLVSSDETLALMVAARMRQVSRLLWARRRYITI